MMVMFSDNLCKADGKDCYNDSADKSDSENGPRVGGHGVLLFYVLYSMGFINPPEVGSPQTFSRRTGARSSRSYAPFGWNNKSVLLYCQALF